MSVTKIRGNTQIIDGTILDAQISASAAISLSKLAEPVVQADGGQALTANWAVGAFRISSTAALSSFTTNDYITKEYADAIAAGFGPKRSARLATAAVLPNSPTYDNGTSGVGATLTAGANGALSVDGVAVVVGNRILVKDQATALQNGIYDVTATGDGSNPYVLTRSTDFDNSPDGEIMPGDFVPIEAGNTYSGYQFYQVDFGAADAVGTDDITFSPFSNPSDTVAGAGLTKTGNTIDIIAGDTSLTVNADDVVVNLNATGGLETSTGVRIKIDATTDGYATVATSSDGLRVVSIKNANIAADAAIAFSKLAALASGNILVGDGSNVATSVAVSGDATLSNAGVLTVNAASETVAGKIEIATQAEITTGTDDARAVTPLKLATTFVVNEDLTVTNGSPTLTLANTPVTGTVELYLNGLLQKLGSGNDYTISGGTITMEYNLSTGDVAKASYRK